MLHGVHDWLIQHVLLSASFVPDPQQGTRDAGVVKIFTDLSSLYIDLFWVNFITAMFHLKYI